MMNYFNMVDSLDLVPDRWYLGEPLDATGGLVDARQYTYARQMEMTEPLELEVYNPGFPLDITFAAFEMPVVRRRVAELIENLAPHDVQRIPARITGRVGDDEYDILNVVREEACVDEARSQVIKWKASDGRPDKLGEYRMVADLHIISEAVKGSHIFRIRGYHPLLICSGTIKAALESIHVTGVCFIEV